MTDATKEPAEDIYEKRIDLATWRKIVRYAYAYPRHVATLAFFAVTTAGTEVAFPLVTRRLVDAVDELGLDVRFGPYIAVYLFLTVVLAGSVFCFIRVAGTIRAYVSHDIRRDGFDNLQKLSFSFYDKRPVGWLMARMTSDCDRLSNILAWGTLDILWGITLMMGISTVLLVLHWKLALVVLGVVPLLAWVSWLFQRRILGTARIVRKTNSRITSAYNEGIMGVVNSKAFVREKENQHEFGGLTDEMFEAATKNASLSAAYQPLVLTLASLATGLALALGGMSVASAGLSLGTLVGFLAYARSFFEPVQEMSAWFAELQMAQASAERVMTLIEAQPEIADSPAVLAAIEAARAEGAGEGTAADGLPDALGKLVFEDVGFTYDGGQTVLEGFSLEVEAGETIALVGPTGGGKSTIASLLCRFYEPTSGRLLVDGVDYRERSLAWWQSNLGIVLQTPHLFSGSIADNIRYGRLEASDEQVAEAAEIVGANAFVLELPDGYATEVGEGGARLSGGQRQLVSFARAILARPRVLVLDEATSSIDTETEGRIQRALATVLEGRTSFVIAHRLSTIRGASRILVIDGGRIVEQGTHAELLAQDGRYRELTTRQRLDEAVRARDGWEPSPAT